MIDELIFKLRVITDEGVLGSFAKKLKKLELSFTNLGNVALAALKPIGSALKKMGEISFEVISDAVKQFSKFEDQLIVARRTMNLSEQETKKLGDSMRQLSLDLGVSADMLAGIAGQAGTLGVRGSENVNKFVEAIAKIDTATNISAAVAAEKIPAILTVYGVAADKMGEETLKIGNVINSLGNQMNSTQAQILQIASAFAGTAKTFQIPKDEMIALSAAVATVEKRIGVAGSAMDNIFSMMAGRTEDWAHVLGINFATLSHEIETKPVAALQRVLEAFDKLKDQKGTRVATEALKQMGLSSVRTRGVFQKLAAASDQIAVALRIQTKETKEQMSLHKEFDIAMGTLTRQWIAMKNAAAEVYRIIGEPLANAITKLIQTDIYPFVKKFIDWFRTSELIQELWPQIIHDIKLGIIALIAQAREWFREIGGIEGITKELKNIWQESIETIKKFGSTISTIISVSIAVVKGLLTAIEWVKTALEWWQPVFDSVSDAFVTAMYIMIDAAKSAWGAIKPTVVDGLKAGLESVIPAAELIMDSLNKIWDISVKVFEGIVHYIKNPLTSTINAFGKTVDFIIDKISKLGDIATGNSVFPDMKTWIDKDSAALSNLSRSIQNTTSQLTHMEQVQQRMSAIKAGQTTTMAAGSMENKKYRIAHGLPALQNQIAAQQQAPGSQVSRASEGGTININIAEGSFIDEMGAERLAHKLSPLIKEQQDRVISG